MDRISMSEMTTFRWSFEEDVQHYSAIGLKAMAVWRQKLSDFGDEKGVELLKDTGMKVSSLHWAGGFTGSDGRSYTEGIADAREAMQLAVELGCKTLVVYTGARAGHTHNHARRLAKSAIEALAPQAEELGVDLAIEAMHPGCAGDCTFLTSLDDAVALIADIESPAVKLVLDVYHLGFDHALISRIAELAPRIGLVQLGDAKQAPHGEQNRCCLGDGVLPLEQVITALLKSDYSGYYEIELLGEDMEAVEYEDLLTRSTFTVTQLLEAPHAP